MSKNVLVKDISRQPFKTYCFSVESDWTVQKLKNEIVDRLGLPYSIILLSSNTKYLKDDSSLLSDNDIENNSSVTLDVKITSGFTKDSYIFTSPIKMSKDTFNKFYNSLLNTHKVTTNDNKFTFENKTDSFNKFSVTVDDITSATDYLKVISNNPESLKLVNNNEGSFDPNSYPQPRQPFTLDSDFVLPPSTASFEIPIEPTNPT
jgi:hypothetical protein